MAEKLLKNRYLIEDVDRDKLGEGQYVSHRSTGGDQAFAA
jgi:hypothetical protein